MAFRGLGTQRQSELQICGSFRGQKEFQKNGEETYANGQSSPEQTLPRLRHGTRLNLMRGGHILFRPSRNVAIVKGLNLPPPDECQQGLIVRIMDKNVL